MCEALTTNSKMGAYGVPNREGKLMKPTKT